MLLATHAGALWGDSVVVAGWSGAGWRSSELLDILITGAPKEHAAGGAPDGDGGSESLGANRSRSRRWSGICPVAIQDGHRLQQARARVHGDEHRTRSEVGFEVACF